MGAHESEIASPLTSRRKGSVVKSSTLSVVLKSSTLSVVLKTSTLSVVLKTSPLFRGVEDESPHLAPEGFHDDDGKFPHPALERFLGDEDESKPLFVAGTKLPDTIMEEECLSLEEEVVTVERHADWNLEPSLVFIVLTVGFLFGMYFMCCCLENYGIV